MENSRRHIIRIKSSARKELKMLPSELKSRIHSAILVLSNRPRMRGVRKLVQYEDVYRIRVGKYRILFQIDDNQRIIRIVEIKHRKDAYR